MKVQKKAEDMSVHLDPSNLDSPIKYDPVDELVDKIDEIQRVSGLNLVISSSAFRSCF